MPGLSKAIPLIRNATEPHRCPAMLSVAEPGEIDLQATELPAFLTEDEPVGIALNGSSQS
jgi:hypothetical protein